MKILVTGSAGHLGEVVVRKLRDRKHEAAGVDIVDTPFTSHVGSIVDRDFVARCMKGVEAVVHAATLHKPHIATHARQDFVDTNISGTLNLLEEAQQAGVVSFIFTSTTSAFGRALTPPPNAPAAWITEDVTPVPKNIYGVTKMAAENLCQLFQQKFGMPCVILRTSRFFPEEDDSQSMRDDYDDKNAKANEFLFRRVDIEDVVTAHLLAIERAPSIGFGRYIISATTPFTPDDLIDLRGNAPEAVRRHVDFEPEYARRGWNMFPSIDRVYVNDLARTELGWRPKYDFQTILALLKADKDPRSPMAAEMGSKGYHARAFADGPYPVE